MMSMGSEGYCAAATQLHALIDRVIKAVDEIDGIKVQKYEQ